MCLLIAPFRLMCCLCCFKGQFTICPIVWIVKSICGVVLWTRHLNWIFKASHYSQTYCFSRSGQFWDIWPFIMYCFRLVADLFTTYMFFKCPFCKMRYFSSALSQKSPLQPPLPILFHYSEGPFKEVSSYIICLMYIEFYS